MYRSLTPFLCLLSALLSGCLSAPPVAEAESGPIPARAQAGPTLPDGVEWAIPPRFDYAGSFAANIA
ncbi:MAG: hypothetical protein LBI68_08385 [Azoarcus sp.]|jgi:hypothetical protein|nr:hypothetical protein [Azoarcus sp.]